MGKYLMSVIANLTILYIWGLETGIAFMVGSMFGILLVAWAMYDFERGNY